ncbi:MAG: cobyrinate a,c-diamide synthase [Paracoccaceae bacterium]
MNAGLILSAPSSGAGKTTITLRLLRAFRNAGIAVRGAKSGPDYIDPKFHQAACGTSCLNLDAWAMSPQRIRALASGDGLLLIEGAMGLFDGAPPDGKGATADLARILDLPVILVIDAAKMAQSVAPLIAGFSGHDALVRVAGVILNNVGSVRHETMLRRAIEPLDIPVLGAIHRMPGLQHPSRHLGLVQASERPDLESYLDTVADVIAAAIDIKALAGLATKFEPAHNQPRLDPPAQSIAIARDTAFAFAYPHLLNDWHRAGASITFFSPLQDEAPADADLVYLPGGYPELHAEQLAAATSFKNGMVKAAANSAIYGECGGYMVLGKSLTDADGKTHAMLDLLPLETSFQSRKLHLGYRHLNPLAGPFSGPLRGHEFHYATTVRAEGPALFKATDAQGTRLPDMGLRQGRVCGSFAHIIDRSV